jgi:hypothetical protein
LGLYSKALATNLTLTSGGASVYLGLSSDELLNTSANALNDAFRTNSLQATTANYNLYLWTIPYNLIYHANSVLEGLERSHDISDTISNQLKGEMLVARSLIYFYLVNLFGDVPYITATDYRVNSLMPRTPSNEIYPRLVSDLLLADTLLNPDYPSANRFRPNKFTAKALLARIYLFNQDYVKAIGMTDAVINSGKYSLVSLSTVFSSAASTETIWALMRDNGNTHEGATFVPTSATSRPAFQLSSSLLASFETADQRKLTTANGWLGKNTSAGIDYYYPNKYKLKTLASGSSPSEFLIVFRLAEQYLIRAEARLKMGNKTGAIQDVNLIRVRAGLPSLPLSLNEVQTYAAIQQEKRIEFFTEWGHRWLDLKRTNLVDNVLGPVKGTNWQSTDVLYPIPQVEMNANPFLIQNPGY